MKKEAYIKPCITARRSIAITGAMMTNASGGALGEDLGGIPETPENTDDDLTNFRSSDFSDSYSNDVW